MVGAEEEKACLTLLGNLMEKNIGSFEAYSLRCSVVSPGGVGNAGAAWRNQLAH